MSKIFMRLMVWLYRRTGGRVGGRMRGAPVLLITTTGRRTGNPWTTPVIYQPDGDGWVVVASNGGAPRNPGWWLNLKANPQATVEIGREPHPVTARRVSGEEQARLWRRMVDVYPGYETYQTKTTRRLLLVEGAVEVVHGRYPQPAVHPVHPTDLTLHLVAQAGVVFHPLAAGYGDLDEHRVGHLDPPVGEQFPVGLEPVFDAFGVVQPVDAEQHPVGVAEVRADLPGTQRDLRAARDALELRDVDRDGERADPHAPAADLDLLVVYPQPEQPLGEAQEVVHGPGVLEADQVGPEQPAQQLRPAR